MSDLCYNCGDCHLPHPCPMSLKLCDICQSWGHAYNFCPLSVRQREPNYQFWALCHNCDKWHLPDACGAPLHACVQCGHHGHREYFCPVNSITRQATLELSAPKAQGKGNKRRKTSDSTVSEVSNNREINEQSYEHVRQIKAQTAREVLNLCDNGYNNAEIMQYMTREPFGVPGNGTAPDFSPANTVFKTPGTEANAHHDRANSAQHPATPSSGMFHSQHEQFRGGEPHQTMGTIYQSPYAPTSTSNAQITNTPVPNKKGTRAHQGCDDCKASRKRCNHVQNPVPADVLHPDPLRATEAAENPHFQFDGMMYRNVDWPTGIQSYASAPPAATINYSMNTPITHDLLATVPTTESDATQELAKSSLKHLLNADSEGEHQKAPQTTPASQVRPEVKAIEGNNVPVHPNPSISNEIDPKVSNFDSIGAGQPFVDHAQADPATEGVGDYVMVPQTVNATMHDAVQQLTHEAKDEEKPKKTRGRPKRKN